MKEITGAYFAGLFDGEGSINIVRGVSGKRNEARRSSWGVVCSVKMTDEETIKAMRDCFGGNMGEKYSYRRNGNKPQFYWQTRAKSAMAFLRKIYPYLKIKKREADIAFLFEGEITRGYSVRLNNEQQARRENLKLQLESLR